MTKIELVEERTGGEEKCFRAVAAHHQAMGRTAGEAIDALTAQIPPEEADTLIIVRGLRGDRFSKHPGTPKSGRLEEPPSRFVPRGQDQWEGDRDTGPSLPNPS